LPSKCWYFAYGAFASCARLKSLFLPHRSKSSIQPYRRLSPTFPTITYERVPTFLWRTIACLVLTVANLSNIRAFCQDFVLVRTFRFSLREVSS
jgi:hypothetical protein